MNWDNFEPVAGFPAGNEPLLKASERDSLQRFLKELRGGKSWVLITSRREERWLDCGYRLLDLRGLLEQEVEELAAKILLTAGVDRAKLSPEYLELLKLLGGHPLLLRVVLPHLKTQKPLQLIEALRQGLDTFQAEEEGRDKSLTVSLDNSFARLSERTRRHLPFLALFSERVNADWLHTFSGNPDNDFGQAYQAIFGENLQKDDWLRILNEAVAAGIVEHLGGTIYKIHPALPWYLRQRLISLPVRLGINSEANNESRLKTTENQARYLSPLQWTSAMSLGFESQAVVDSRRKIEELEKKLLVFYARLAYKYDGELIGNAELASFVLRVEEPNLLQNLRLAEQPQSWKYAHTILRALGQVYERIGRKLEFRALRQRALSQIGIHLSQAKAKEQDALNFWMYLREVDANEAILTADLKGARAISQEILDELTSLNDLSVNEKIAGLYHQLGIVAQEHRRVDEAISYFVKALRIYVDKQDLSSAGYPIKGLGRMLKMLEKRQFDAIWREVMGQECPENLRSAIQASSEENEE